jgi:hypothetical protein
MERNAFCAFVSTVADFASQAKCEKSDLLEIRANREQTSSRCHP